MTIPASVKIISDGVFCQCHDLYDVVFEDPNGWMIDGKEHDLNDPKRNAEMLKNEFVWQSWLKEGWQDVYAKI